MNDNTRRQWERYCAEHFTLSVHERFVLYWLVHDHSAAEGFTRPGVARLAEVTGAHRETVITVLAALVKDGAIAVHRESRGRRATEYAIPWLRDPVDNRSRAVGNPPGNPTGNPTPSSSLREEQRSGAREGRAPAAAQAGDATDWCQMCEEHVPDGTPCPCVDCSVLIGCRVNPRTAAYYAGRPLTVVREA